MGKFIDLTGKRIGVLEVLHRSKTNNKHKAVVWVCRCVQCKKLKELPAQQLNKNRYLKCLCQFPKGESYTPTYKVWNSMIGRTAKTANIISRKNYYDRGITVTPEWRNYFTFKEWALKNGFKPYLQLDRIDNNKGYSPENCRFVSFLENMKNLRATLRYNNEHHNDADKRLGLAKGAVYRRVKWQKWSLERAFNSPNQRNCKYKDRTSQ